MRTSLQTSEGRAALRSLVPTLTRLKLSWLVVSFSGLGVVAVGLALGPATFTVFVSGVVIGFACNAYFSCEEEFLLRGCRDAVYLVSNRTIWPQVHEIPGRSRSSVNAFGGVWHAIVHVSDGAASLLSRLRTDELNIDEAELYKVDGEASVFAVVLGTRYGIPDMPTLTQIWGAKVPIKVSAGQLDRLARPGRDLMSVQYWPEKDR
jgi:hypothetical protein